MSEMDKYKVNYKPKYSTRTPIHMQKALIIEQEPGWEYFVMNNTPGRREMFERAGWVAVEDKAANKSDNHVQNGKHVGSELTLTVNRRPNAACNTATVMRIPKELYREDFNAQQVEIDKKTEALDPAKNSINGSTYGEFQVKRGK